MPNDIKSQVENLTPRMAFHAVLDRLYNERAMVEVLGDRDRLCKELLERLCPKSPREDEVLIRGRQIRDVMAERLRAIELPELQLLGAAVIGCDCGARIWSDTVRSLHGEAAG
jgi:hypothetical protein